MFFTKFNVDSSKTSCFSMFLYALLSKFCSRFVLEGKSIKNTMLFHDFAKHVLKTHGFSTFYLWRQCGGLNFENRCLFGNGHAPTKMQKLKHSRLLKVSEATHQKSIGCCVVFATRALHFDLFAFQVPILAIKLMKIYEMC